MFEGKSAKSCHSSILSMMAYAALCRVWGMRGNKGDTPNTIRANPIPNNVVRS